MCVYGYSFLLQVIQKKRDYRRPWRDDFIAELIKVILYILFY